MWYMLTAYNSEACYGWTRDPDVVEAALCRLNRNREINVYSAKCLGDDENENGYGGTYPEAIPLKERDDLLFDDDTTPDDFRDDS